MKKLVYTLSFVTLLGIAAKAQTQNPPQDPKAAKSTTLTPITPTDEQKSRMAITQKGVPASKSKNADSKDAKGAATEPKGQPTEKH